MWGWALSVGYRLGCYLKALQSDESEQERKGVSKDGDVYKFAALCLRTRPGSYARSGLAC